MWLVLTLWRKKTCRSNEVWLLRPEHKPLCNPPCSLCAHHFLWTKPAVGHFVLKIMQSRGEEGAKAMILRSLANCSLSDFFFPRRTFYRPMWAWGDCSFSVCVLTKISRWLSQRNPHLHQTPDLHNLWQILRVEIKLYIPNINFDSGSSGVEWERVSVLFWNHVAGSLLDMAMGSCHVWRSMQEAITCAMR